MNYIRYIVSNIWVCLFLFVFLFQDNFFLYLSDENTYFICYNLTQSLDGAVLFLKLLSKFAKGCRGAD